MVLALQFQSMRVLNPIVTVACSTDAGFRGFAVSDSGRKEAGVGLRSERRIRKRWGVSIPGKLFVPDRQVEGSCAVLDLSADGAGLKSACSAAMGARVVLYVDGFGRYEGRVVQRDRLRLGVQFVCTDAKRARIVEQIASFVQNGKVATTDLRRAERTQKGESLQCFRLASGRAVPCEIADMALTGASLNTQIRPPVGEIIRFGGMSAVVVRHTETGIAVKFLGPSEPPPPPFVRMDVTV